ncbi:hypothetical protein, conserved [Trypanosoma cruzi]|uniref:RING-type domain-containing protein n=1 Tax=Trypanosoma cruzi (strain CL Brener) TaxID=353153 RepID=Q4D380_TRYCC|nr:hypothetical protein, conserved [Trypanosoma cruzi]EAN86984.1 hypothetical protein, conserved [Trypanosoma cruzi]|eukprot:XP_808835.1 hypothetical protein [Trypanosoma cruzi strain CL Brener]
MRTGKEDALTFFLRGPHNLIIAAWFILPFLSGFLLPFRGKHTIKHNMNEIITRFFSSSSHCKPEVLGRILHDVENLCNTFHFYCRDATWGVTQQEKLCIYGGLPITIKKSNSDHTSLTPDSREQAPPHRYVLPLQIWLTHLYPIEPPLVFLLSAEQGCRIASNHKYVDATGRCHTPELAAWHPVSSSLCDVVKKLCQLLSAEGSIPLCFGEEGVSSPSKGHATAVSQRLRHGLENGDDDKQTDEHERCVVCFSPKETVLVPCGHYCLCDACATNVTHCPLCRGSVKFRQRVFS